MLFQKTVTIPANTPESDPVTSEIILSVGVMNSLRVYFPPGPSGLAHAQVWLQDYQLLPWERGEWSTGDDLSIVDNSQRVIYEKPTILKVVGWNEDTQYNHNVYVFVEMSETYQQSSHAEFVALPP